MRPRVDGLPPNFDTLVDNIRKVMLDGYYRPDSCVAATRMSVDVLTAMGITARGLRVRLLCYNPFMARKMDEGMYGAEVIERWPDQAWSVGVGLPVSRDQPGTGLYVIAWADTVPGSSRGLLVDMALDQASRPEHGMPLTSLVTEVPRGMSDAFLSGDEGIVITNDDGAIIAYSLITDDDGAWMRSPNWSGRDTAMQVEIVNRALSMTSVPRADRRRWAREQQRRMG